MPILGSSASQSGRVPGQTTGVSAVKGNAQATVSFTPPAYTGKGNITYTVTSSPGGITASGASSPITVTGLTNGTAYTFTVTASAGGVGGSASSASAAVTPAVPEFVLAQTFNASGNYTIPNTAQKYAVYTVSGGSNAPNSGVGGAGGFASGVIVNSPSLGTTYTVTVGGPGGTSSFGTLLNSSANGNASGIVVGNSGGAAGGNAGRDFAANEEGAWTTSLAGGAGGAGGNIVLTNASGFGAGLPNAVSYGGGGGGVGGRGQNNATSEFQPKGGGAGGSPYGGGGASRGGNNNNPNVGEPIQYNGSGATGNGPGGGGGGSFVGGTGASGQVLVYVQ